MACTKIAQSSREFKKSGKPFDNDQSAHYVPACGGDRSPKVQPSMTKHQETGTMRTDHETPTPFPSNGELSRDRRHRRSGAISFLRIVIPLFLMTGSAIAPPVASAGSTYSIVNYPSLYDPVTLTGSITTDGKIGTLSSADITNWNITESRSGTTATLTPSDSTNASGTFEATPFSLKVANSNDLIQFNSTINADSISWAGPTANIFSFVIQFPNGATSTVAGGWDPASVVASVPEPSSVVLAALGTVVVIIGHGWSRHRQARRRQASA
jgi:hypothetical protein